MESKEGVEGEIMGLVHVIQCLVNCAKLRKRSHTVLLFSLRTLVRKCVAEQDHLSLLDSPSCKQGTDSI